jgi:hypothetical protein
LISGRGSLYNWSWRWRRSWDRRKDFAIIGHDGATGNFVCEIDIILLLFLTCRDEREEKLGDVVRVER